MNHRAFVAGLGAMLATPLFANAQQTGDLSRRFLTVLPVPDFVEVLRQELRDLGSRAIRGRHDRHLD